MAAAFDAKARHDLLARSATVEVAHFTEDMAGIPQEFSCLQLQRASFEMLRAQAYERQFIKEADAEENLIRANRLREEFVQSAPLTSDIIAAECVGELQKLTDEKTPRSLGAM